MADIPGEFPPWQTVYWYYRQWVKDGTWDNINRLLIANNRMMEDKEWQPTTAIIDSQTTKNTSTST
uniref:Transposase n=1 Tax=Chryseobacterium endophyticum TaxID=1854762 RepID=A0AAU6WQ60_9FLAO